MRQPEGMEVLQAKHNLGGVKYCPLAVKFLRSKFT